MARQRQRSLEWLRNGILGLAILCFGVAIATGDVVIGQNRGGWIVAVLGAVLLGIVIVGAVRRRGAHRVGRER